MNTRIEHDQQPEVVHQIAADLTLDVGHVIKADLKRHGVKCETEGYHQTHASYLASGGRVVR